VDIITAEALAPAPGAAPPPQDAAPYWQAAGLSTGFPVPTGYAEGSGAGRSRSGRGGADGYDFYGRSTVPRARRADAPPSPAPAQPPPPRAGFPGAGDAPLRPVFRTSPFLAEFQRQRVQTPTARILFLDEGGEFRAVLGAALLRLMLGKLRAPLDVSVECASIGPPAGGVHDARLRRVAAEMGVPLAVTGDEARRGGARRFDEVADAVSYDLILVMDRFDYQEVLKEVAVLDAINPGGFYAGRIRRLGPFGMAAPRASPRRVAEDIDDPLYGLHPSADAEAATVRGAARELAFACRGLASYLLALQARRGRGMALREALAQSLQCPLLAGGMVPHRERLAPGALRHVTQDHGMPVDDYFTVRMVRGQRRVVRRPARARGFWQLAANVDEELRAWMRARRAQRLPTQRELRASGASSLASAVDAHGGLAAFARRLGVPMAARRPNGYWDEFENLARALKPYLVAAPPTGSASGGAEQVLPTQAALGAAGRADLLRAIRHHGGSAAVAARLGVGAKKGTGWSQEELVEELRVVAEASGAGAGAPSGSGAGAAGLPSRALLVAGGRRDLAAAVQKLGGFEYFRGLAAAELAGAAFGAAQPARAAAASPAGGLRRRAPAAAAAAAAAPPPEGCDLELLRGAPSAGTSAAAGREPVIEVAGRQMRGFVAASPAPSRLPTHQELLDAGRPDLWTAAQRAGGMRRLAEHLGLALVETRGRRRAAGGGEGGAAVEERAPDPREEIDLLDAYEEVVFI
jgi:protein-tyrosine-phosphatase/ribosomal protein L13E